MKKIIPLIVLVGFCCVQIFGQTTDIYTKVFKQLDGGYYTANQDKIFFEYDEDYFYSSAANIQYKIYKESDLQSTTVSAALPLNLGDNRNMIDLSNLSLSGFYILEIENSKKEKRYLRFKI